jgi:5-methylcytosine-specific restriction endonuclease McrA
MRNENRPTVILKRWNAVEDDFIKTKAFTMSKELLASSLGRSVPSVVNRLHVFGLKPCSRAASSELRKCSQCKDWKQRDEFYENKTVKDGLASNCKICASANTRKDYQNNIEARRAAAKTRQFRNHALRRTRKLGAKGHHSRFQWKARVDYFGWRCRYCRTRLTIKTLTKDHVIPLAKGGSEWASNLVPACWSCNQHKHVKSFKSFIFK